MKPRLFTALICLFFCQSMFWGQTQGPTKPAEHVSQMADEKIEVSRLDWIMLTARVRMLEQIFAHETSRTISPIGVDYNSGKKRVVIKGFVDPTWIASARMEDAKNALKKEATSYCVDGLMLAEAESGEIAAGLNTKDDCSVQFLTWAAKGDKVEAKEIAWFENNELVVK